MRSIDTSKVRAAPRHPIARLLRRARLAVLRPDATARYLYDFGRYQLTFPNPKHGVVARSLYLTGVWEPEVTAFLSSLLQPHMVVIDIGAHRGYYAALFASFARQVVCFEVNHEAIAALHENIQLNQFKNVTVIDKAVYSRNGYLRFHNGRLVVSEDMVTQTDDSESVACVRLDDAMAAAIDAERVDLIKIDVEGAEWDVIDGARHVIATHRPYVVVEVHGKALAAFGHSAPELLDTLTALGYTSTPIDSDTIDFSRHENLTIGCTPLELNPTVA